MDLIIRIVCLTGHWPPSAVVTCEFLRLTALSRSCQNVHNLSPRSTVFSLYRWSVRGCCDCNRTKLTSGDEKVAKRLRASKINTRSAVRPSALQVLFYLEDFIIFGAFREVLESRVKFLLTRLNPWNFSIKTTKCNFNVSELEFCGFKISATFYQTEPVRLTTMVGKELPWGKSDLISVTGHQWGYHFAAWAQALFTV